MRISPCSPTAWSQDGRWRSWYAYGVSGTSDAERLARTYVWWQEPERTLAEPGTLLRQILRMGRAEDYVLAERIWGEEALRRALKDARPGEIDRKSEHFWRLRFGPKTPSETA